MVKKSGLDSLYPTAYTSNLELWLRSFTCSTLQFVFRGQRDGKQEAFKYYKHSFTNLKIRMPNLKIRSFVSFLIPDSGFGFGRNS